MITREEYEFLKKIKSEGYTWIARDKNWKIFIYQEMPRRYRTIWNFGGGTVNIREEYFTFITWEDEEPTKILDLMQEYESHQIITGENTLNDFFGTDNFNIKYVPQFKDLLSSLKKDVEYLENKSSFEHRSKQEETNMNKSELIKEIEEILDDIGVSDYQLGECDEDTIWTISSITIREILSAIEKYSPDCVKATVPQYIADWILEVKALERSFKLELLFDTTEMPDDVFEWLDERYGDTDILAKAWLDGYEVEKEKLYTVRLANGSCLYRYVSVGIDWIKGPSDYRNDKDFHLTQSEIESVDPILMKIAEEVE